MRHIDAHTLAHFETAADNAMERLNNLLSALQEHAHTLRCALHKDIRQGQRNWGHIADVHALAQQIQNMLEA